MFDREARILKTLQDYAGAMLDDVRQEEMCLQPTPSANHAAWIIGHLAYAADMHSKYAGAEPKLDATWETRFGLGSSPSASLEDYPPKAELIQSWHKANDNLIAAANSADPDLLNQPTQGPLSETLPTVADFLAFSMTGHTATHIGQLSAWRRAIGRPKMF